jgi:hypothetical protein
MLLEWNEQAVAVSAAVVEDLLFGEKIYKQKYQRET